MSIKLITGIIGFSSGLVYSITSPEIEPDDQISKIESVVNSCRLFSINKIGKSKTRLFFGLINGFYYATFTLLITKILPTQNRVIVPFVMLLFVINRMKTYSEFYSLDLECCISRSLF